MDSSMVVVLVGLLTVVTASSSRCTPLQILKVKNQWQRAYGIGRMRDDFGLAIWRSIFAHDPTVLPLFERVHGDDLYHPDFIAHSARVFGALESLITLLDQPDTYEMQVAFLRSVHNYRNLAENHIWLMKNALMRIIPAALQFCFDEYAWNSCLDKIMEDINGSHS
ncbi:hypothetical protein LSH36_834g00063 [Paralvinella palmiformis]|uniref:Extracellular globin n=1 Tax=Paralvinella palmiformis TaxID=53620 RepID=A0AAD9IZ05_9ANNE|nr:hypothetical protein LSH36_834g00063 [Paralvinella palmiformis]